jgi:CheY-like chemotaxis protein
LTEASQLPLLRDVDGKPYRILVVEDDGSLGSFMVLLFEEAGCEATLAPDLNDGIRLLGTHAFDLVLVDGFASVPEDALSSAVPILGAAGAVPVMLFTAHPIRPEQAQEAGFRGLITKPFDVDDLLEQLQRVLNDSASIHD